MTAVLTLLFSFWPFVVVILFFWLLFLLDRPERVRIVFYNVGGKCPMPITEKVVDTESVGKVRFVGKTKGGKPHDLENVVVSVADGAVASAVISADDPTLIEITPAAVGSTVLALDADGRIGEGVFPVHGELTVTVVEPDAAAVEFEDVAA